MKYFVIAGEPSGDLHGSNLMREITAEDSCAQFQFWGGDKMAQVGGTENLLKHYRESSFFGFAQVIKNLGTISKQLEQCKQQIADYKPDVVILIDYPGFNMKIAKFAHELGFKVYYYIAPKVWASREGRIKAMRKYIDELFIIFPFEQGYFRAKGIKPHFEGNPLVDSIEQRRPELPRYEDFIAKNNLAQKPIIALLAGSRKGEIAANLPLMINISRNFPNHQFVVAGVNWLDRKIYEQHLDGSPITYIEDQTYELLSVSEAAIVTSGTATLETALIGTPEVVVYRIPWLHQLLKPLFLKIKWISLVNINLERECVREILQSSLSPKQGTEALAAIMEGGKDRQRMMDDFEELRQLIGEVGASKRFAKQMYKLLTK